MQIPGRGFEDWADETIGQCRSDISERLQRGSIFRALYLTGDANGERAIYPKIHDSIEDWAAYLCSTDDLRYRVKFPNAATRLNRAKAKAVAEELRSISRQAHLDLMFEECTKWAGIKGNTYLKLGWTTGGLEAHLVMPEAMGVFRPDINGLDSQEAFVHSTYITRSQFMLLIKDHPDKANIARRALTYAKQQKSSDAPDQSALLKQIIVGGFQPYTGVGNIGAPQSAPSSGMAQWLSGPYPSFDPKVVAELLRIDELWVKDDATIDNQGRREYSTIQRVGNVTIFGKEQRRNIFADMFDPDDPRRVKTGDDSNPLAFKHPFVECGPNYLHGYHWGLSEMPALSLLQQQLNNRVNGINNLLRMQERPPRFFQGGTGADDAKAAKLNKPGGYLHEPDVSAKPPLVVAPALPPGLFDSLHETERQFDVMTGMTPTLQGMAQPSVRSHGQADTMTRNATPRFKKKAIRVERFIQQAAGLLVDILRAKCTDLLVAWVMPGGAKPIEAQGEPLVSIHEPPAEGMIPVEFHYYDLTDDIRVEVDGHSASPAFADEAKQDAILLKQAGVISPEELIEAVNPPNADEMIADAQAAQIAQAAFAAAHPEEAQQQQSKGGKKK